MGLHHESASTPAALKRIANVQPLHLARAILPGTNRDAAGGLSVDDAQHQRSRGRSVLAGQAFELFREPLKRKVDRHPLRILAEECAHLLEGRPIYDQLRFQILALWWVELSEILMSCGFWPMSCCPTTIAEW
jgi:hypothetical protein